jgi:hypothetical protein
MAVDTVLRYMVGREEGLLFAQGVDRRVTLWLRCVDLAVSLGIIVVFVVFLNPSNLLEPELPLVYDRLSDTQVQIVDAVLWIVGVSLALLVWKRLLWAFVMGRTKNHPGNEQEMSLTAGEEGLVWQSDRARYTVYWSGIDEIKIAQKEIVIMSGVHGLRLGSHVFGDSDGRSAFLASALARISPEARRRSSKLA